MARQQWQVLRSSSRLLSPLGGVLEAGIIHNSSGCMVVPMRKLKFYSISYTLGGKAIFQDAHGRTSPLVPGSLTWVFPGVPHHYGPEPGQSWDELYVGFVGPVFDLWTQRGVITSDKPVMTVLPVEYWLSELRELLAEPGHVSADQQSVFCMRFQTLLARMIERGNSPVRSEEHSAWVDQACKRLIALADRQAVDWDAEADEMAMSYEGYRRRFRRLVGVSPARFHAEHLIHNAANCMLRDDPGNKALAEQFGFANEFYFSRRFRQVMKCTPTEFKRRLLANIVPPNTPSTDKRSIHFGATSSDPAPGLFHPPPKVARR